MSKVVFVGNVPYNMGEDQLIDVFKSVGQVVGFRLVFDRDTGKPRGYGFCEFADHETAASAVRNLNNVDVGGRPLRIDLADSDPFLEGKTTVRGELVDSGESRAQWRERERDDFRSSGPSKPSPDPNAFMAGMPTGVPIAPGSTALDTISNTLGTMNPSQLIEVLAQVKAFVITHPEQARTLLVTHPQLAYALFQALLLNKIVDQGILSRMLAATTGGNAPVNPAPVGPGPPIPPPRAQPPFPPTIHTPQPTMPPPSMPPVGPPNLYQQHPHHPPPMNMHQPPPFYRPPPPPQSTPQQGPPQAPPNAGIDPAQRQMLMQVLSLTPDQINALPPDERNAIQQLRNQFIGGITA